MLNETMKDLWKKFALSSSSISETTKEFWFSHHFSIERSSRTRLITGENWQENKGGIVFQMNLIFLFFVATLDV